jgi:hypothetical protein
LSVVVAGLAVAGVLWAAFSTLDQRPRGEGSGPSATTGGGSGNAAASKLPVAKKRRAPTNAELKAALARCGLGPKVLTAAGVSAQSTTTLVGNVRQYLTDHPDDLGTADADFFAAQGTYDQLLRAVQQGQSSENDRTAFRTAPATLAAAQSARDSALAAVRTAAMANLSQDQQAAINTIRANAGRSLPVQYLAVTRSEADWVALRDALSNDRQATSDSVDPDATCHQRLLNANAAPATSRAAQNLSQYLADVSNAFNTAVTGG